MYLFLYLCACSIMVLDYCSVILSKVFWVINLGLRWPANTNTALLLHHFPLNPFLLLTNAWFWRSFSCGPHSFTYFSLFTDQLVQCISRVTLSMNILTSSLVVVIKQLGLSYARTNTRKTRLLPTTCKAFTCTIERGVGQHRSTTFQSYLPFGPVTNKWKKQELGCEAKKCAFHIGINGI